MEGWSDYKKRKRGRPRICPFKRKKIIQMREEGYTYRAIAYELQISEMTVWRYWKDYLVK